MNLLYTLYSQFIDFFIGRKQSFQHRLQNLVFLLGSLAMFLMLLVKIRFTPPNGANLLLLSSFLAILLVSYAIGRLTSAMRLAKWLCSFLVFPVFLHAFFISRGIHPDLMNLFLVYFMILMLIWQGRFRFLITGVFTLVMFLLFSGWGVLAPSRVALTEPDPQSRALILTYLVSAYMGALIIPLVMRSYQNQLQRASQSDKLKASFLSNISHEIRTPMNAILGFSQLLDPALEKSSHAFYIRAIQENSSNLMKLMDNLIDLSELEAGTYRLKPAPMNLTALMEELNQTFGDQIQKGNKRNVSLVMEQPEEELWIHCDFMRLREVLAQILQNAVKFTDKGRITFGYKLNHKGLHFHISDTGRGIRPDGLDKIFDPFHKIGDEISPAYRKGAGIGLAISRKTVELMGGRIWAESEGETGTCIRICLPLQNLSPRSSLRLLPFAQRALSIPTLLRLHLTPEGGPGTKPILAGILHTADAEAS
ncbi:MAG: HAMP domain-containing sensor histidine kinase [Bacteroidales bacterium]